MREKSLVTSKANAGYEFQLSLNSIKLPQTSLIAHCFVPMKYYFLFKLPLEFVRSFCCLSSMWIPIQLARHLLTTFTNAVKPLNLKWTFEGVQATRTSSRWTKVQCIKLRFVVRYVWQKDVSFGVVCHKKKLSTVRVGEGWEWRERTQL